MQRFKKALVHPKINKGKRLIFQIIMATCVLCPLFVYICGCDRQVSMDNALEWECDSSEIVASLQHTGPVYS